MELEITAQPRSTRGKGSARRMRMQDMVPAVAYGAAGGSVAIAIKEKEIEKLLRDIGDETRLVSLKVEGESGGSVRKVLIKEVQAHPFRRQILHVDFFEPSADRPVVARVPIDTFGKAQGEVKGGKREILLRNVKIRCLSSEIPDRIKIDVSGLDVGQTMRIEDLRKVFPFEFAGDDRMGVVTILPPKGKATKEGGEED